MPDFMINALTGIVLTAAVAAVIGTYIVTRRMLFISGGITHACFGGLGQGCEFANWRLRHLPAAL